MAFTMVQIPIQMRNTQTTICQGQSAGTTECILETKAPNKSAPCKQLGCKCVHDQLWNMCSWIRGSCHRTKGNWGNIKHVATYPGNECIGTTSKSSASMVPTI